MSTELLFPKTDLKCTVISLVPFEINEHKPGLIPPYYHLKASDGKTPSLLHVGTAAHYVYLDETRGHLPVRQPSNEVARSIVEDFINSQLQLQANARPALFWVPGEIDLVTVVSQLKSRISQELMFQKNWFINLVKLADDDWNRYHRHTAVSDFQRTVAQILGMNAEEHPWMSLTMTVNMPKCPSCNNPYEPGTVVCPQCSCVLDKEKFKTLEFAKK